MMARGPVEWVRSIAAKLPSDATREEIVHACIKKGINAHTARTQVSKYLVSQGRHTRRTKDEMTELRERIITAVTESPDPISVRGAYYRLAALTPPEETIVAYNTIQALLVELRESGEVEWEQIIDPTRGLEEPYTQTSLSSYVRSHVAMYRLERWTEATDRPLITLEKQALAARVKKITDPLDVPYLTVRGYASITALHDLADWIEEQPQTIHVYHFGDWNPSGEGIQLHIEDKLRLYGAVNFTFKRVAITEAQIKKWKLFSRPANDNDARTPNFTGKTCTDLDALSKEQLQGLVRGCITQHIDWDQDADIEEQEAADRKRLARFAQRVGRNTSGE
jgi:hypothetical protein